MTTLGSLEFKSAVQITVKALGLGVRAQPGQGKELVMRRSLWSECGLRVGSELRIA